MTRRVLALVAVGALALLAGCASTPRGIPLVGLGVLASPTPTAHIPASTPAAGDTKTQTPAATPAARKCVVTTDAVDGGMNGGMANIRACPSVHCAVVRVAVESAVLRVLGERGDWWRVRDGWIWKPLCEVKR